MNILDFVNDYLFNWILASGYYSVFLNNENHNGF